MAEEVNVLKNPIDVAEQNTREPRRRSWKVELSTSLETHIW